MFAGSDVRLVLPVQLCTQFPPSGATGVTTGRNAGPLIGCIRGRCDAWNGSAANSGAEPLGWNNADWQLTAAWVVQPAGARVRDSWWTP